MKKLIELIKDLFAFLLLYFVTFIQTHQLYDYTILQIGFLIIGFILLFISASTIQDLITNSWNPNKYIIWIIGISFGILIIIILIFGMIGVLLSIAYFIWFFICYLLVQILKRWAKL